MSFGSQAGSWGPSQFFRASLRLLAWISYFYLPSNGVDHWPFVPSSCSWSSGSAASFSFSCCSCELWGTSFSLYFYTCLIEGLPTSCPLTETLNLSKGRLSDRQSCRFRGAGMPSLALMEAGCPPCWARSFAADQLGTGCHSSNLGSSSMGPSRLAASSRLGSCLVESLPDPVLLLDESNWDWRSLIH